MYFDPEVKLSAVVDENDVLDDQGRIQRECGGVTPPQSSDTVGKTVSVVEKSVSVGQNFVRRQKLSVGKMMMSQ